MSTQPNHFAPLAAKASHVLLYALRLVLPLLGCDLAFVTV